MTGMQAISLWEPWATLVAIGAKRIETRKKSLGIQPGPLAICSTAMTPKDAWQAAMAKPEIAQALKAFGLTPSNYTSLRPGHVLAVVYVLDVIRGTVPGQHIPPVGVERHFGDYRPGRVFIRFGAF